MSIPNQDKVNIALNYAQIAQTTAMNSKLEKLQQAQLETANIQKQIVEINSSHFIIGESIFYGLDKTIKTFKKIIK